MTITRTELTQPVAAFEPPTREAQPRRVDPALDGQSAAVNDAAKKRDEAERAAAHRQTDVESAPNDRVVQKAAKLPGFPRRELAFRLDPETHRVVIQVIDSDTKTVLRQYPPDESIQVLKQLRESRGLILDEKG